MVALVEQKYAGVFVQDFQQAVDIHERQIVYRKEVTCPRRVGGPSVGVDIEQRLSGRGRAALFDLDAATAIELRKLAALAQGVEFGDFRRGQFARTTA